MERVGLQPAVLPLPALSSREPEALPEQVSSETSAQKALKSLVARQLAETPARAAARRPVALWRLAALPVALDAAEP